MCGCHLPRRWTALVALAIALAGAWPADAPADVHAPLNARVPLEDGATAWLGDSPSVHLLPATLYEIHQLPMPPLPLRTLDINLTQSAEGRYSVVVQSNLPAPREAMTLLVALQGDKDSRIRQISVEPAASELQPQAALIVKPLEATPDTDAGQSVDPQVWGWIATAGLLLTMLWSRRSARARTSATPRVASLTRRVASQSQRLARAPGSRQASQPSGSAAEAMLAKLEEIRAQRDAGAAHRGIEVRFGDELAESDSDDKKATQGPELLELAEEHAPTAPPEPSELITLYEQAQTYLQTLEDINSSAPPAPTPNPLFEADPAAARQHEMARMFASIAAYEDKLDRLNLPASSFTDDAAETGSLVSSPDGDTNQVIRLTKAIKEKLAEISLIVSQSGNDEHSHWLLNHLLRSSPQEDPAPAVPGSAAPHREEVK